jgi:hypothetical protein
MSRPDRPAVPCHLRLKPQEIPYDHPHSDCLFDKNFVSTRNAFQLFGPVVLFACLLRLQTEAERHHGLDHLQVFENLEKIRHDGKNLWFIQDGVAVTALLPEDY